jgi:hypothetical protein
MKTQSLTQNALRVIDHFNNLRIGQKQIRCPYMNNKNNRIRASLRVKCGKGSPKEIEEEAQIEALKKHVALEKKTTQEIRQFLIDNNIGVDCSGFAFYILQAQFGSACLSRLKRPEASFVRQCIAKWRPVENTNVAVLAHEGNSVEVKTVSNIRPGDMIIIRSSNSKSATRDHVLIVTHTTNSVVAYAHSLAWASDGQYGHGIKHGSITVTDPSANLLKQTWTENGKTGEQNESWRRASEATSFEIKRLRCAVK